MTSSHFLSSGPAMLTSFWNFHSLPFASHADHVYVGLISEEQYQDILEKERLIKEEIERVEHVNVGASKP